MSTSESTLSFDDIPEEAITQAEEYLRQLLKEEYPSMDLTENRVIYENVIRPAAILHAQNRADIDTLEQSFSPLVIAENPDLADEDMTDAVFANYGIERFEGSKATGLIAVIISSLSTTAVPANSIFTANGLTFVVTQAYVGVTTQDAVISSSERLIEARTDGSYVFTVPVVASNTGEQYRLKRNSRFTVAPTIGGVIDLSAAQDFEGGTSAETNEELVQRAQAGIAPKVFSGRAQIEALIQDELPSVTAVSQVGFGDPEMLRDRHNIFEISTGGKADLYVRTYDTPDELKVTKSCTYLGSNLWTATIGRDDAPGFYLIDAVVQKGETAFSGSLEITSEVRGYDLTPETDEFVPTIEEMQEAAYTRYQTAVVTFKDETTDPATAAGATAEYDFYILRMVDLQTVHDLTVDRTKRPPTGDYLVKAPVPALTAVNILVQQRTGTATIDTAAIQQAVASRANSLGFNTGKLYMSLLVDAAQGTIEPFGSAVVTPVDMYAYIYPPDTVPNGRIELRDPDLLEIPDLPERGVTQRTTCFYLDAESVSVSVQPMSTVQI
jgi:hypothetical protein